MSLNANQFETDKAGSADHPPSPQQQHDFTSILANSVHDMKNSVNMLLGALDDISGRCGGSSCPSHELLSQLRYEGKRLNSNLVQMLMLYRVNNSQYTLNIEENDVYGVLEECYLENEGILSLKGITIELACPDGLMGFFDRELVTGIISDAMTEIYTSGVIACQEECEATIDQIHYVYAYMDQ